MTRSTTGKGPGRPGPRVRAAQPLEARQRDPAQQLPDVRRSPTRREIPAGHGVVAGNRRFEVGVVADGHVVEPGVQRADRVQIRVQEPERAMGELVQVGDQARPLRRALTGPADEVPALSAGDEPVVRQDALTGIGDPRDVRDAAMVAEQPLLRPPHEVLVQRLAEDLAHASPAGPAVPEGTDRASPDRLRLVVAVIVGVEARPADRGDER